jgi:hypothetical protein
MARLCPAVSGRQKTGETYMNSGIIVTLVIVIIAVAALVYLEMNSRRNSRNKGKESEE